MKGSQDVLGGFAERLLELRSHYQMGQRRFAQWLDLPPTTYHEYERKKRQPLLEAVVHILNRTGVAADWLLRGRGPMFPPERTCRLLKTLRKKADLPLAVVATGADLPVPRLEAFEAGEAIPDLTVEFPALAQSLALDPVARQRLFDAVEREFRPLYFGSYIGEEEKTGPGPQTTRVGKFLEPWQLRHLLDDDEECFRIYQAQPLARKASLVMRILRDGIDDPKIIKQMIYGNFTEIKILEQVRTLLESARKDELVSYIKFLLHKREEKEEEH